MGPSVELYAIFFGPQRLTRIYVAILVFLHFFLLLMSNKGWSVNNTFPMPKRSMLTGLGALGNFHGNTKSPSLLGYEDTSLQLPPSGRSPKASTGRVRASTSEPLSKALCLQTYSMKVLLADGTKDEMGSQVLW